MRPASSVVGYGLNNKARQYAFPPPDLSVTADPNNGDNSTNFFSPRSFVRLFYSFISNIILFFCFFWKHNRSESLEVIWIRFLFLFKAPQALCLFQSMYDLFICRKSSF